MAVVGVALREGHRGSRHFSTVAERLVVLLHSPVEWGRCLSTCTKVRSQFSMGKVMKRTKVNRSVKFR